MKNNRLPSAEMVGLNSGKLVLMFGPRFSTLTMVDGLMIFSFCETILIEVSSDGCAIE